MNKRATDKPRSPGDAPPPSPPEKAPEKAPFMRGAKRALTLLLQPEMFERVDRAAAEMGQTRNGWISAAVARALREQERERDG